MQNASQNPTVEPFLLFDRVESVFNNLEKYSYRSIMSLQKTKTHCLPDGTSRSYCLRQQARITTYDYLLLLRQPDPRPPFLNIAGQLLPKRGLFPVHDKFGEPWSLVLTGSPTVRLIFR